MGQNCLARRLIELHHKSSAERPSASGLMLPGVHEPPKAAKER